MVKIEIAEVEEESEAIGVFIEGKLWRVLNKKLFINEVQKRLSLSSIEEFTSKITRLEEKLAKNEALKTLSKRSLLISQLKEKLKNKLFSGKAIELAISYCQSHGFLNEERRVEYLVQKEKEKGKGPSYIKAKLRVLGVDEHLIQTYCSSLKAEQEESINTLLQTKLKKYTFKDPKEKQKIIQYLQRRGFSLDSIFDALKKK